MSESVVGGGPLYGEMGGLFAHGLADTLAEHFRATDVPSVEGVAPGALYVLTWRYERVEEGQEEFILVLTPTRTPGRICTVAEIVTAIRRICLIDDMVVARPESDEEREFVVADVLARGQGQRPVLVLERAE